MPPRLTEVVHYTFCRNDISRMLLVYINIYILTRAERTVEMSQWNF
jgi:hypothetical protein